MTFKSASLTLAAAILFAAPAFADPADGCANCHGKDGVSTDVNVPTIAGMSAKYLADTLGDYQKKSRPCPEATFLAGDKKGSKTDMCQVATALSAGDVASISKSLSAKPYVKSAQASDAALAAKGKAIHDKLCEKCHTESGTAADDDSGFLGGQKSAYLLAQLKDYKDKKRPVPTKMQPKLDEVQPADFDALAAYYASVK